MMTYWCMLLDFTVMFTYSILSHFVSMSEPQRSRVRGTTANQFGLINWDKMKGQG